jgi:hypothetical protein
MSAAEHDSFLGALQLGTFRWDLIHPFVTEGPEERAAGDSAVAELTGVLAGVLDPDAADAARELPGRLVPELAAYGFLAMTVPQADGGRDFPPYTTFRLLAAAAAHSGAAGLLLAVHNGLSVAAYLRTLPAGPLRDHVVSRIADGIVFGVADTEPSGAGNSTRQTRAVPVPGGYEITGEKWYIGNARIAGLLAVSATVTDSAGAHVDLFVVDVPSPGFAVVAEHDFLGFCGAPSAAIRLDRVYVPGDRRLVTVGGGWRQSPVVSEINALARLYITAAPALGLARQCLGWSRDFLLRRRVDNRPLGEYSAIQRLLAGSLADVFAFESVAQWSLLGDPAASRWPERTAMKNIGTELGWRVGERTVSLLGAEGLETAPSKARRGVPALPAERALRDLRGLRIAGGVDFNVDLRTGWSGVLARYCQGPHGPDTGKQWHGGTGCPGLEDAPLTPANLGHVRHASVAAARLARYCAALAAQSPAAELAARQSTLIAINQLVNEVFTMSVSVARAARLDPAGTAGAQRLADVYGRGAQARIAALWRELESPPQADHAALSRAWLTGALSENLLSGSSA